ncbi:MAG: polysaccharide deacetylase family protein [Thiolinea sp.]
MNWPLIGMLLLVLLIIIVIAATTVFFIRHWANRATNTANPANSQEGYYFTRYTPPQTPALEPQAVKTTRINWRKLTQYTLSTFVILGILGLLGAATYYNRDKLAATIDLSEQDLQNLQIKQFQWAQTDSQILPELAVYIDRLKAKNLGLILINTPSPETWPRHEIQPARQATDEWLRFAAQHKLETEACDWEQLQQCRESKEDWIHILLPGLWDASGIHQLMPDTRLIAYGPPLQIYQDKTRTFKLGDLSFRHKLTTSDFRLSLVGDRELTLGFDAGMIIAADPAFRHYRADSARPQGKSINTARLAGGNSSTRLYAEASGQQGRFVWMDFPPNDEDHDDIVPYYLHSVLAAIFRYLDGQPYSALANWPEGKHFAALMEEDTEDGYDNAYKVASYFQENNYPITWYALSNEAQEHRELTRLLAATGEIACHGDTHMDFPRQNLQTQYQRIARCRKVMQEITGRTVLAFRPPREEHNGDTFDAMTGNGIRHFIAEVSGDRFTPIAYSNEHDDLALISIPRMNSDDYLLWNELELTDKASTEQLKQEVDWIKGIGGLFMFSFHTQYMNDYQHLQTVKSLADYIAANDAFFATTSEIADWWRFRTQLKHNKHTDETQLAQRLNQFHPVLLTVDENGKLQQKIIKTSRDAYLIKTKE